MIISLLLVVFLVSCQSIGIKGHGSLKMQISTFDGKKISPTIIIDGNKSVTSTSKDVSIFLTTGEHQIKVQAIGYKPFIKTVDIQSGNKTPSLNVVLMNK